MVKAYGGEAREDLRLATVVSKWSLRTSRAWIRGTWSGTGQNIVLLFLRAAVIGLVIWLWANGQASPGDVAAGLTARGSSPASPRSPHLPQGRGSSFSRAVR